MPLQVQCKYCPRLFNRRTKYFQHANKEHLEQVSLEWVVCEKCQTYYPLSSDLDNHKRAAHSDGQNIPSYQCEFCSKKYNSKQNYYSHARKAHRKSLEESWFLCQRCDNFFPSFEALRNHENNSHDGQKMRTCHFCPKVMSRMSIYYKHANECHKGQLAGNWACCDVCQNYYPSKSIVDKHKMSMHGNNVKAGDRIQCELCPKQLISTHAYYSHANKIHLNLLHGRWFGCDVCQKYFPNKPVLESHKSTVHSKFDTEKKRAEKVTCDYCSQSLRNRATFYKHANRSHQSVVSEQWHQCDVCKLFFPSPEILDKHKKQRHNPDRTTPSGSLIQPAVKIKCKFCSRTFNGNIWYYKHANIAHFNLVAERWVFCDKCETYVPSEISLKRHQRKYHAETVSKTENRVNCKFCPKMFLTSSVFFLHANRVHRDLIFDKWLVCNTCQRYYPSKKELDTHKCRGPPDDKIDTRSQFVPCGFCDVIENNASAYYKHANKDHQALLATSNWLLCTICQSFYPDKDVLRSHKKHSHERALQPKLVRCRYCSLELPDQDAFYRHANMAHLMGLIGKWLFCVKCQYFYPNKAVLESHESEDHDEVAKVIVVQNSDSTDTLSTLNSNNSLTVVQPSEAADTVNMSTKSNRDAIIVLANPSSVKQTCGIGSTDFEKVQCSFCEKTFAERHHFINHANKAHTDQVSIHWLSCASCAKFFPDENVLLLHTSHTHQKERLAEQRLEERRELQENEAENDSLKLVCAFCPKSFKHRSYYFCHANKAHAEELMTQWLGCDGCDKRYPTKSVLMSHKARFHRYSKPQEIATTQQYIVIKSEKESKRKRKMSSEHGYITTTDEENFWNELGPEIRSFRIVVDDQSGEQHINGHHLQVQEHIQLSAEDLQESTIHEIHLHQDIHDQYQHIQVPQSSLGTQQIILQADQLQFLQH